MGACLPKKTKNSKNDQLDDYFNLAEIRIMSTSSCESMESQVSRNPILRQEGSPKSFKSSTAIMCGTVSCENSKPISVVVPAPLADEPVSSEEMEEKDQQTPKERSILSKRKDSETHTPVSRTPRTPINNHTPVSRETANVHTPVTRTYSQTTLLTPMYKNLDQEVISTGQADPDLSARLEAMKEKYHSAIKDRDQLLAKNLNLSSNLKKSQAQKTIQKKEAQRLVSQAQRESAQWKEFATSAQTENAALVNQVNALEGKLQLVDPETLEAVKQYQTLMVELEQCKETNMKLREQKMKLQKREGELEIMLEQEKLASKLAVEMRAAELNSIIERVESSNVSLLQQIQALTISLNNAKIETDIARSESQMLRWLLDERKRSKEPTTSSPKSQAYSKMVDTRGDEAPINQKIIEEDNHVGEKETFMDPENKGHMTSHSLQQSILLGHSRSCSMQSAAEISRRRSNGTVEENMTVALSLVMARTAKHQKEFNKLYDQYQVVVKERDEAVGKADLLHLRFGEQIVNDPLNPIFDSSEQEAETESTADQGNSRRINNSTENLTKKNELLELELKHKKKIITYLERELHGQLRSSNSMGTFRGPIQKWEHTRNQIFSSTNGDDEQYEGELEDDGEQKQAEDDWDAEDEDAPSIVVTQERVNSEDAEEIRSVN